MKNKTYKIYCYTCLVTGKKYVGQTCLTMEKRAGYRGYNYKCCSVFGRAIQKFGWENFVGEILEDGLTFEQANEREEYWISKFNTIAPNGYNLQPGGGNHTVNELSRQKMSENRKGKYKVHNREYQSKPVRQYTKDFEFVAEYPSTKEAQRQTGISSGNIGSCCNGRFNYAGGFVWVYVGQPLPDIKIFKKNPVNHRIRQITLDGEVVAEYESTAEAAKKLGCYAASIRNCLIGKMKSAQGFYWQYASDPIPDNIEKGTCGRKEVCQFTLDGQFISEYPSLAEASRKVGIKSTHICACCRGQIKTAGGFIWKYKEVA